MWSPCVREPLAKDERGSAKATLSHPTRRRGGGRSGVQGQVLPAREVCPEGHQEGTLRGRPLPWEPARAAGSVGLLRKRQAAVWP